MFYNVEIDKIDGALEVAAPAKYLLKLIESFEYGIKHKTITITVKNQKVYIHSDEYDLDDLAENIILDDLTLEYRDVKTLIPPQYPVLADWEN